MSYRVKWELTLEQHEALRALLEKTRPKLREGLLDLYLDNVGRVVDTWLQSKAARPERTVAADLDAIGNLADRLQREWMRASSSARYLVAAETSGLRYLDRGFDYRAVHAEESRINDFLVDLRQAAITCHDWQEPPIKKPMERQLLADLVDAYYLHFGRLPSRNAAGAFGQFARRLTEEYLPETERFSFGHELLAGAIERCPHGQPDPEA